MFRAVIHKTQRLASQLCFLMIGAYRVLISSWTKNHCRFYPSCSRYAQEALKQHGTLRGLYFTVRRLLRCHPFHPAGVDLVPPKREIPNGH